MASLSTLLSLCMYTSITNSGTLTGDSFDCTGITCLAEELYCDDNTDCFINCSGTCQNATFNCPTSGNCLVTCTGSESCGRTIINSRTSTKLNLICYDYDKSCIDTNIYCPDDTNNVCNIAVYNNDNNVYSGMNIYSINGLNTVRFAASSSLSFLIDIYCTSDYSQSCTLESTTPFKHCSSGNPICDFSSHSPTSLPTTNIPTNIPTINPITNVHTTRQDGSMPIIEEDHLNIAIPLSLLIIGLVSVIICCLSFFLCSCIYYHFSRKEAEIIKVLSENKDGIKIHPFTGRVQSVTITPSTTPGLSVDTKTKTKISLKLINKLHHDIKLQDEDCDTDTTSTDEPSSDGDNSSPTYSIKESDEHNNKYIHHNNNIKGYDVPQRASINIGHMMSYSQGAVNPFNKSTQLQNQPNDNVPTDEYKSGPRISYTTHISDITLPTIPI